MTPGIPNYVKSKHYNAEKDVLMEGASKQDKLDYEDLHNGFDWMLSYRELEPDMKIPYKRWDGKMIDLGELTKEKMKDLSSNEEITPEIYETVQSAYVDAFKNGKQ